MGGGLYRVAGFEIAGFLTTPAGIATVGDMGPADVARFAIQGLADLPTADALWVPCTAIQTIEAIPMIEACSGRPVVSGTQALLWHALRILDVHDLVPDAGRLFS